jgi:2-methylisocitrate lyase-like PEP mutase family enzyme
VFLFAVDEESGRLDDVIARGEAYATAGADCIFVPGLLDLDALRRLAGAVELKLNAMWLPGAADLRARGRRRPAGTALAQAAYTHAQQAAVALLWSSCGSAH